MNFFSNFDISSSAMTAQRIKMDVISTNIANIDTVSTENGGPYLKKTAIIGEKGTGRDFQSLQEFRDFLDNGIPRNAIETPPGKGAEVKKISEDRQAVRYAYKPGHPLADENGYVKFPDINIIDEMIEMIKASRVFEANLTAMNEAKSVFQRSLEIGKS